MNIDLFSQYIRDIFRIEFNGIETDDLIYQFNANAEPIKYIIKKDKLENTINEFLKLDKLDDTSILTKTSIETLVSIESSRPYLSYSLFKESDLRVFKDNTNQIIYEIGKPSDIYLIHMLCVMKKYELNKILPRALIFSRMNRERDNNLNNDFFDFLKNIIPRFYTLKVNSSTKKSESEFQDLSNACLFQLSYNLNIPIIQVKFFPNCEYPLRNGLCSDAARPLLQAGIVVLVKLCSIFVELTQVQCLRSGHKTCKRIMQVLRPTLSHGTC
jgi:hypothetical protein